MTKPPAGVLTAEQIARNRLILWLREMQHKNQPKAVAYWARKIEDYILPDWPERRVKRRLFEYRVAPQQAEREVEWIARQIWSHQAPEHHVEWDDERNKAEYRLLADSILDRLRYVGLIAPQPVEQARGWVFMSELRMEASKLVSDYQHDAPGSPTVTQCIRTIRAMLAAEREQAPPAREPQAAQSEPQKQSEAAKQGST